MDPCKYLDICKEGQGALCYNYDCSIAKIFDQQIKPNSVGRWRNENLMHMASNPDARMSQQAGVNLDKNVDKPQPKQLGDNANTTYRPTSAAAKSDYSVMSESDQKHMSVELCSKFKMCPEASEQCNEHYQSICKKLENYLWQ